MFEKQNRKFPSGSVVRTPCFHWGCGFSPWLGNLRSHKLRSKAKRTNQTKPKDVAYCCSVARHVQLCIPWSAARQASLSFTVFQNLSSGSCSLSQWCCPTISSSVAPFYSWPQSFPASRSLPVNWLCTSGGQNIEASTSASVLPMNIQDWFPLGLTRLISLVSKGLSRVSSKKKKKVSSSTTVWKHQFFGSHPSLWCNFHIHTWLLEKP